MVGASLDEIQKRSWLACLSMRYDDVLGDLADPRTTLACISLTGLPGSGRCSRVFQVWKVLSSFLGKEHAVIGRVRPRMW